MSDLIERLKKYLDLIPDDLRHESPNDMIALLDECLAALSPVLPDDVAEMITNIRKPGWGGDTKVADLLERQAREVKRKELIILALKARVANWDEMAERIEQLEHMVKEINEWEDENEQFKKIVERLSSTRLLIDPNDCLSVCDERSQKELKARIEYARTELAALQENEL